MTVVERAPLTRPRVVCAALEFIDDHGVDALSMRKLGQALGVEAMSLYNYVTSKDDLLDGVASRLLELVDVPDPHSGDWRDRVRAIADNVRRIGLAHPRAFPLLASRKLSSLDSWAPIVAGFALAQRAGLTAEDSVYTVTTMCGFVVGFVLLEIGGRGLDAAGERLTVDQVPVDRPLLREYVAGRAATTEDEQFARGLDLIIGGIEHRLAAH